ncbi:MAG: helix-turn-helix domain-containing protein [Butyricicoccus sp.]
MERLKLLEAADQLCSPVWDEIADYVEVTTVRDGRSALGLLQEQQFDLVLVNLRLSGLDGLELLRRIRNEKLCPLVVLTSDFPDFQYAQQGIIYGAFDYLLRPLTADVLLPLIFRAQEKLQLTEKQYLQECTQLVQHMGQPDLGDVFDTIVADQVQKSGTAIQRDVEIRRVYQAVIDQVFIERPWLHQFQAQKNYEALDWMSSTERNAVCSFCRRRLIELSNTLAVLQPPTEDTSMQHILQDILEHVDGGCLQKDIASAHFLSRTALSEMFRAQLGRSYQSYVTEIKMLRAQYLLSHTDMKIYEISARLGYKDVNYFSRIFRKRYGVPLSQFRRTGQDDYQI